MFDNRKTPRMIAIHCFRTLVCIVLIVVIFITEHTLMQAPQVQEGGLILETSSSEKWRAKSAPSNFILHHSPKILHHSSAVALAVPAQEICELKYLEDELGEDANREALQKAVGMPQGG